MLGLIIAVKMVPLCSFKRWSQVYIRLIRKYSTSLNGVDLSQVSVGDVMFLPDKIALMLIEEGWAERLLR